jgi:hypothetical protein
VTLTILDGVADALRDEGIAVGASIAAMWILGHLKPEWWAIIFAIAIGWVIADSFLGTLFIAGEKGAVHIPMLGPLIQSEGYNYIAFLSGIVVSTLFATKVAVEPVQIWLSGTGHPVLYGSIFIGGLVYYDLRARYYVRSKTRRT